MKNDPAMIGVVKDVTGYTVSVALNDDASGLSFINGHAYRVGQIGSFVRIPIGYVDLFGIISQVGAGAVPEKLLELDPHGFRWITIQLVGEGERKGNFSRGISQYPTIGDKVYIVTEEDLIKIYGKPDEPHYVKIGRLASAESIPALIDINKLVTRHCAIVGTTGSGKSTTVAGLLFSLSENKVYPSARIMVIDIHGEYANALKDKANIFKVYPDIVKGEKQLSVPYWAMNFDELMSLTLGDIDGIERGAVLEKITLLKLEALKKKPRNGVDENNLTVDTPVPFSIHKMWFDLHRLVNATHNTSGGQNESTEALLIGANGSPIEKGDALKVIPPKYQPHTAGGGTNRIFLSQSPLNLRRPLEALASRLRDPRYAFLFRPGKWEPDLNGKPSEDLDILLKNWVGGEKTVTILDLSGIPPSILTNLIGVLLRIVYDSLFWSRNLSEGGRERPLLIMMEEAHLYLYQNANNVAASIIKRITKEGRKYGIGAVLISQRPSEIDPTVLSQCGTFIALRMSNANDRAHISSAMTENMGGFLDMLPILRTGEAIIVGEAVNLPIRALITTPPKNRRPDSFDPLIYDGNGSGGWNRKREKENYNDVVETWRKQDIMSPKKEESMNRIPVSSSNVAEVGYDQNKQILEVMFTNGSVYQYFDVPEHIYQGLISDSTVGGYLNENVKGHFRYAKV